MIAGSDEDICPEDLSDNWAVAPTGGGRDVLLNRIPLVPTSGKPTGASIGMVTTDTASGTAAAGHWPPIPEGFEPEEEAVIIEHNMMPMGFPLVTGSQLLMQQGLDQ